MKKILLIISLLYFNFLTGQNLVPNPSFEEHPERINANTDYSSSSINVIINNWYPLKSSIGYCLINNEERKAIFPKPEDGLAYICLQYTGQLYRGCIQAKLIYPLEKGKMYCAELYIYQEVCDWNSMDKISIVFSEDSNIFNKKNDMIKVSFDSINCYVNKKAWTKYCDTFIAKGGEEYLTIGNFEEHINFTINKDKKSNVEIVIPNAGYYIDNVSVVPVTDETMCNCPHDTLEKPLVEKIEVNKPIVLENVLFETNKTELLPQSIKELNKLTDLLNKNPKIVIEVSGHTDNIGKEEDNINLSKARAKSVRDYLVNNKIDVARITYKGYGSSKPIADNNTVEGKKKNRRVEFKVVKIN